MFLAIEAPKLGIAMFFILLSFDMNPSTWHYEIDSVFAFVMGKKLIVPLHLFYELGLIIGWVIRKNLIVEEKFHFTLAHLLICLMLFWMMLGQLNNMLQGAGMISSLAFVRVTFQYLLFFYFFDTIKNEKDVRTFTYIILAGLSLTLFVGIFRFATDTYIQWGLRKFFLWKEQVHMIHMLGLFALLAGIEKKVKLHFLFGFLIYFLCMMQIFLSTARSVFVGAAATIGLLLFLKIKNKLFYIVAVVLIVVVIFVSMNYVSQGMSGAASQVASGSLDRLTTMSFTDADLSVIFRFISYQSAFLTALKNPVLGIGFNTGYYIDLFGMKYFTRILDNTYLKFALSAGFPLLFLYLVYLVIIYRMGIKLLKHYSSGIMSVIVLTCIGVQSMGNTVDLFESNFAFFRIMPLIIFTNAVLAKLYFMRKNTTESGKFNTPSENTQTGSE